MNKKIKAFKKNIYLQIKLLFHNRSDENKWRKIILRKNTRAKIAAFLCSDEYKNSSGLKRFYYNFKYKTILDTHGTFNLPDYEIEALARCFLPDIIAFFESAEGKAEFEKWKSRKAETEKIKK